MNAIETKNLVKRFGDFTAVKGINIRVREGEIYGFLGPNGAGKSTSIHMLTTLLMPTAGVAKVAGYDVQKETHRVRECIALVPQESALDGALTGEENLVFYGRLYHLPKAELMERIGQALKFVELETKKDVQVKFYSGGMRRRLEIAKTLILKPKILFLDEPSLGLDPQSRAMVWERIRHLNQEEKITIFLTTHYMEEADELCNRISIIDYGKILVTDTPRNLKKKIGGQDILDISIRGDGLALAKKLRARHFTVKKAEKNHLTIRMDSAKIAELTKLAQQAKASITSFSIHQPSLEDVFIHYTGHNIREESASPDARQKAIMRSFQR